MTTFEVDFIFCCPCFATSIFDLRFHNLRKIFEFSILLIKETEERFLTLTVFQVNKPCLLVVLWICHWSMQMLQWILTLSSVFITIGTCFIKSFWVMDPMLRENAVIVIEGVLENSWSFFLALLFHNKMRIDFVKVSSAAVPPTKGSTDAAEYNLYSVENSDHCNSDTLFHQEN